MWPKEYKDYKKDHSLVKSSVEPTKGIIGCEMHDLNGWGNTLHHHDGPYDLPAPPKHEIKK